MKIKVSLATASNFLRYLLLSQFILHMTHKYNKWIILMREDFFFFSICTEKYIFNYVFHVHAHLFTEYIFKAFFKKKKIFEWEKSLVVTC